MTAVSDHYTTTARIVIAIALILIALALLKYGLSAEAQARMWHDIFERPGGPMSFRFFLQPLMATIAAAADGYNDARLGRSPYFWTILHDPDKRQGRLTEGVNATARILLIGVCMDAIYQYRSFDTFYPMEALIIAIALAFIPYLLLRGPAARIARWWMGHHGHTAKTGGR
jgi:hypothetical protein